MTATTNGQRLSDQPTAPVPTSGVHTSAGHPLVELAPAISVPQPTIRALGGFDELRVLAESFQDAQDVRIRIENRLRSGTIPPDLAKSILEEQRRVENMIDKAMRKAFRRVAPDVYQWVKDTPGLGDKLMARLLGTIGHPVIATPHHWEGEGSKRKLVADPPFMRNVAKLWAYCGHGDPARKRRKGMTVDDAFALGNPQAKKLVYLIAQRAMMCTGTPAGHPCTDARHCGARRRSPYRDSYDMARAKYADRGWTLGHQQAAALRLVGKEILRDLWVVSHPAKKLPATEADTPGGAQSNGDTDG